MDHVILQKLNSVSLKDHEGRCIHLDNDDIRTGVEECGRSVFLCLQGGRGFNIEGFKAAMTKAWQCPVFNLHKLDEIFYQGFFDSEETVKHILENGPWCFDNSLILLRPWQGRESISLKEVEKEFFWVHVSGLPRFCYTEEVGRKLTSSFEECREVQIREELSLGHRFFRFRVSVDLTNPLPRCVRMCTPDGIVRTGIIKYERLPVFCFYCGLIGHRYRQRPLVTEETIDVNSMEYGSWMGGVDGLKSKMIYSSLDAKIEEDDSYETGMNENGVESPKLYDQGGQLQLMNTASRSQSYDGALVISSPSKRKRGHVPFLQVSLSPKKQKLPTVVAAVQPRREP